MDALEERIIHIAAGNENPVSNENRGFSQRFWHPGTQESQCLLRLHDEMRRYESRYLDVVWNRLEDAESERFLELERWHDLRRIMRPWSNLQLDQGRTILPEELWYTGEALALPLAAMASRRVRERYATGMVELYKSRTSRPDLLQVQTAADYDRTLQTWLLPYVLAMRGIFEGRSRIAA